MRMNEDPSCGTSTKRASFQCQATGRSPCSALVLADICTHSYRLRTQAHMQPECPVGEMVLAHLCCLLYAAALCNGVLQTGFLAAHLHGLSCGSPRQMLKGRRKPAFDSASTQASLHRIACLRFFALTRGHAAGCEQQAERA